MVNQQLSAHQLILSREAMDELMQRLPLDLESFHQELIKLTLFGTKISRDDVVHLSAGRWTRMCFIWSTPSSRMI